MKKISRKRTWLNRGYFNADIGTICTDFLHRFAPKRVADPEEFTADVTADANLVIKTELPMLKGSFGLLLLMVIKYFIWPPAKFWWHVLKRKCKY